MSNEPKIKSVDPLIVGMTPQELKDKLAGAMARKAERDKAAREDAELLSLVAAQNEGKIAATRYEAFALREKLQPLQAENEQLIREHTNLMYGGEANVPRKLDDKGALSRVEAKIKFSAEEKKVFAARLANEKKAVAKTR